MEPGTGQGFFGVLFYQQKLIPKRDLCIDPLEGCPAQRVNVTEWILVKVLALPDIRVVVGLQSAQASDVDKETGVDVNPARIDNIMSLSMLPLPTPRIDIQ